MRMLSLASSGMVLCALVGCLGPEAIDIKAPGWVTDEIPQSPTAIYAVASWPRTRFEDDAVRKAKAAARAELARTIQVKVKGELLDWQNTSRSALSGQGHVEEFFQTISRETLDVSMSGSQIVQVWVDRQGLESQPGTVWVLAKLDKSSLAQDLLQISKEAKAKMTPEQKAAMGENADKALEDLDHRLGAIE